MKEDKKNSCYHHTAVAWLIAVLLGFVLIALVFKTGLIIGLSKSSYSSCGMDNYKSDYSAHYYDVKKDWLSDYKTKADAKGMSIEEYKTYLGKSKSVEYADFEAKAKANGMTMEEYKKYLAEQTTK